MPATSKGLAYIFVKMLAGPQEALSRAVFIRSTSIENNSAKDQVAAAV
ncbi:hypothetical protein ABFT51_14070 [Paenibacillus peoriae]